MEQPTYPQQALAIRRHTALLSLRTYTPQRHLIFDAILRMSLDCGRASAPVLSQAWFARMLGIDKGDFNRAEKFLERAGMLKIRQGADHYRLYEPQFDIEAWGGDKFRWRLADPGQRKRALQAEEAVANSAGPGPVEQTIFPYEVEPTIPEEYREAVQQEHIRATVDAAGVAAAPHLTSSSTSSDPEPLRGTPAWFSWKERRGFRSGAGLPASVSATEPASALGVRPTQGGQSTARRPLSPEARWEDPQRSDPTPGGSALGGLPTQDGPAGPSEPSGARGVGTLPNATVGRTPNALGRLPTPGAGSGAKIGDGPNASLGGPPTRPSRVHAGARMSETSDIYIQNIKGEISLTSNIAEAEQTAPSGGMQDVAGAAEGKADGLRRAPDELLRMVFAVVRVHTPGLVMYWKRQLAPADRQNLALDLLGEIKIRADQRRRGIGKPIDNDGAWFVGEFYRRAGIPRKGKGGTP